MRLQTLRRLNPKKLLLSKWTAATPHKKEKHFIVVKLIQSESSALQTEYVEVEAVYSRYSVTLAWRELTDIGQCLQG